MGETTMVKHQHTSRLLILSLIATLLSACAGPSSNASRATTGPLPTTPVTIADFKTVAGVWEGVLLGLAGPRYEGDWVMMRIGEDGSYEFASFREVGTFQGHGTLRLSEGRLYLEGPRGGRATFTLYANDDRRLLRADGVAPDGRRLTADLTPKQARGAPTEGTTRSPGA
jgi:hypothetical protein